MRSCYDWRASLSLWIPNHVDSKPRICFFKKSCVEQSLSSALLLKTNTRDPQEASLGTNAEGEGREDSVGGHNKDSIDATPQRRQGKASIDREEWVVLTVEERQELKQLKQNSQKSPGHKEKKKGGGKDDIIVARKARQLASISRR